MKQRHLIFLLAAILAFAFPGGLHAQFKQDAFTQNYNDPNDTTSVSDTTDKLFSFKEWYAGMSHKQELKIGTMFASSVVLPGTAQIYNKQYWKLPIVYGAMGALAGTGGYYMSRYKKTGNPNDKTLGTWLLVGMGACYWASLMDGVASYKSDRDPLPGRATIYSILLPGLGQAYNGEYWKIPIYHALLIGSAHFLYTNDLNYKRYKKIHNEATSPDIEYNGPISGDTAKYYRDVFRRYRDYSILAVVISYMLQVIDANVFSYMNDFEVTDDITFRMEPAVIATDNIYATTGFNPMNTAVGMRLGISF